jgi:predicted nucleic acid-binding protein
LIYVDSSVALAEVFGETRRPPREFWDLPLVASRLTDLEMRTRALASGVADRYRLVVDQVAGCISFTEIEPVSVELIYAGGTRGLRTLDAIHLATLAHFNAAPGGTALATYDRRLAAAAQAMGFQVIVP